MIVAEAVRDLVADPHSTLVEVEVVTGDLEDLAPVETVGVEVEAVVVVMTATDPQTVTRMTTDQNVVMMMTMTNQDVSGSNQRSA